MIIKILLMFLAIIFSLMLTLVTLLLANVLYDEFGDSELMHAEICERLHGVYKAKNADYGDSFAQVRKKYYNAILIRLSDKLNRLDTLLNGSEQHVHDESIDDTLLDLANYCIMELLEREMERREHADTENL